MTQPASTVYTVVSTAIRSKLLTSADLVSLLTQPDIPETKVYLLAANPAANLPYVRMHHVFGGEPAQSPKRSFDQLWMVNTIAFDQSVAMSIDAYVQSLLLGQRLDFIDGWLAWADITKNGEYSNITNMQGQEIWEVGAYYRIRGVKGN